MQSITGERFLTLSIVIFAVILILLQLFKIPLTDAENNPSAVSPRYYINSIGMKLVYIPAGDFKMGSKYSAEETAALGIGPAEWYMREHPQHLVKISSGFYMGVFEVTQAEYVQVMGYNPSTYFGEKTPVDSVTWNDAAAFCEKLSALEGRTYRLPTEAEWEYACKAGSDSRFSFGGDIYQLYLHGNYADSCNTQGNWWLDTGRSDGYDRTAPAGNYPANAFGLFDMHGNLWEFCSDWYREDYYADSPTADPQGPVEPQSSRVLRGGSWHDSHVFCRATFRHGNAPDYTTDDNGFRVVLEAGK